MPHQIDAHLLKCKMAVLEKGDLALDAFKASLKEMLSQKKVQYLHRRSWLNLKTSFTAVTEKRGISLTAV
jgi:hypothetical protein